MPDEQPYFLVRVTRCGECPHFISPFRYIKHCGIEDNRKNSRPTYIYHQNKDGITPSCPMWAQRVEPNQPKEKA